jgi:hypothetical protein
MARPPDPKHAREPLRLLRGLVKATLQEFSDVVGVPVNTLRGIENGHRNLSPSIEKAISDRLFAVWNKDLDAWVWKYSKPPRPYDYHNLEQFFLFLTKFAPVPDTDLAVIKMRIDVLFKKVPKDKWMRLFWRLQESLNECGEEFGLAHDKEVKSVFGCTADKIHFSGMAGRNLWLQRTYSGRLRDFGLAERSEQMEVQGSADLSVKPQLFT